MLPIKIYMEYYREKISKYMQYLNNNNISTENFR
jgi:hypothetical protein